MKKSIFSLFVFGAFLFSASSLDAQVTIKTNKKKTNKVYIKNNTSKNRVIKKNRNRIVVTKPNRPKVIVKKPNRVRPGYIWVQGYWKWNSYFGRYVWQRARWKKIKRGHYWNPGYWEQTPHGFFWIEGCWVLQ